MGTRRLVPSAPGSLSQRRGRPSRRWPVRSGTASRPRPPPAFDREAGCPRGALRVRTTGPPPNDSRPCGPRGGEPAEDRLHRPTAAGLTATRAGARPPPRARSLPTRPTVCRTNAPSTDARRRGSRRFDRAGNVRGRPPSRSPPGPCGSPVPRAARRRGEPPSRDSGPRAWSGYPAADRSRSPRRGGTADSPHDIRRRLAGRTRRWLLAVAAPYRPSADRCRLSAKEAGSESRHQEGPGSRSKSGERAAAAPASRAHPGPARRRLAERGRGDGPALVRSTMPTPIGGRRPGFRTGLPDGRDPGRGRHRATGIALPVRLRRVRQWLEPSPACFVPGHPERDPDGRERTVLGRDGRWRRASRPPPGPAASRAETARFPRAVVHAFRRAAIRSGTAGGPAASAARDRGAGENRRAQPLARPARVGPDRREVPATPPLHPWSGPAPLRRLRGNHSRPEPGSIRMPRTRPIPAGGPRSARAGGRHAAGRPASRFHRARPRPTAACPHDGTAAER